MDRSVIDREQASRRIAELIEAHMGIEARKMLEGRPFTELHEDFDSLSILEIQFLVEQEYGFEFEMQAPAEQRLPVNVFDLADQLIAQHQRHLARQ